MSARSAVLGFFGRRNACANCSATDFVDVEVATEGEVRSFTIVAFAAPECPFRSCLPSWTAAVPACAATSSIPNPTRIT